MRGRAWHWWGMPTQISTTASSVFGTQPKDDIQALLGIAKTEEYEYSEYVPDNDRLWCAERVGSWVEVQFQPFKRVDFLIAYWQPKGDGFVVSDLGSTHRALRMAGVDLLDVDPRMRVGVLEACDKGSNYGPWVLVGNELGTVCPVSAEELPTAIYRVMLASYAIAGFMR